MHEQSGEGQLIGWLPTLPTVLFFSPIAVVKYTGILPTLVGRMAPLNVVLEITKGSNGLLFLDLTPRKLIQFDIGL
jgi:hypothetical protein